MGDGWWLSGWRRQEVHGFWHQEEGFCRAAALDKIWSPGNFFRELERITGTALGLTDGFNHPSVGWKGPGISNAGDLWKVLKMNFLMQLIDEPARRDALLDVLPTDRTDQVEDEKVKGSHGCSGHETVELKMWRAVSKINRVTVPEFRRAEDQLGKVPWETALEDKGAHGSWVVLKNNFFRAPEWFSPLCRVKHSKGLAGMNRKSLTELK